MLVSISPDLSCDGFALCFHPFLRMYVSLSNWKSKTFK